MGSHLRAHALRRTIFADESRRSQSVLLDGSEARPAFSVASSVDLRSPRRNVPSMPISQCWKWRMPVKTIARL